MSNLEIIDALSQITCKACTLSMQLSHRLMEIEALDLAEKEEAEALMSEYKKVIGANEFLGGLCEEASPYLS